MEIEPKENSDLLRKRNKVEANGIFKPEEPKGPPDGGIRAYSVLVASFLINGLVFSVINTYSLIYTVFQQHLKDSGVPNSESRAALVGSLCMGMLFFMSPVSGVLSGIVGLRSTTVLGGVIASSGLLISSFNEYNVDVLYFTYSIMYGLGASLAYTPSLAILGHYFKKRLGLVNGIVTIGSSVFTVLMPPLMEYMIHNHGLAWLFRLLALFTFGVALCGLLFKPSPLLIVKPLREDNTFKALLKTIINVEIWKNKQYRYWALSIPLALFGYFVPYVHIKKFLEINYEDVNYNLPLQCIAIMSGVGRLTFGWLADKPGINRILLQQMSFYAIGTFTILIPFVNVFGIVVAISLCMGLFDGAFIALIGPIAFQFCGAAFAPQAIGCMFGLAAIPLSVGPTIGGYLFSVYQSYTLPFVLAGISPLVGATLMFAIPKNVSSNRQSTNGVARSPPAIQIEQPPGQLLRNGQANQQTNL